MADSLSPNAQIILAALNAAGPRPTPPTRVRVNPASFPNGGHEAAQDQYNAQYQADLVAFEAASGAWDQSVKSNARDIKVMLSERSGIMTQLTQLDKIVDPNNDGGKVFPGTIVRVTREERSKRGIVVIYTGTDRATAGLGPGEEQVRTDRTDNEDGRALARRAQQLIGHKVLLYIELEQMQGGNKVRVVRHFEDRGLDHEYNASTGTVAKAA
ncbi:hypothetical protein [Curtobacterium sp. MCBD17_040]|uniref:hypothetical protein n=1 Tax=Curtobacterium sp. MCBD17_040 TaxID=2175674 RepID=UPI000DA81E50|nr:hypothetical protein [Curtobacterium sp. MCBD17_040]WIB65641.1 hypothetical protein DEI94_16100 [Curtobacterium sp. MCBD17_040]